MKRVILIVLDGVGVGYLPDAHKFGDESAATLPNIAKELGGLHLPHLQSLGLGNIVPILGVPTSDDPLAATGKMAELSPSKDSISGHWEIAGLPPKLHFDFFPDGFSQEIIDKFVRLNKLPGVLLNKPYSGTEAIAKYGQEHIKSKKPIIYTSADSVFQIACHEQVYTPSELYTMCRIAREQVFDDDTCIGRIIARPFLGSDSHSFYRTDNRKDFAISPTGKTVLDYLSTAGKQVVGIGKIEDLFNRQGITKIDHTKTNQAGIASTIEHIKSFQQEGLIFTNLVDFDSQWGHRNLPHEFAQGLQQFDKQLPAIMHSLQEQDILIITADHGCDPTFPGTDHTREYTPLLVLGARVLPQDLGTRRSFADIAATIAEFFALETDLSGDSFLKDIYR